MSLPWRVGEGFRTLRAAPQGACAAVAVPCFGRWVVLTVRRFADPHQRSRLTGRLGVLNDRPAPGLDGDVERSDLNASTPQTQPSVE